MKCPNCNSSVTGSWKTCRCGYNLLSSVPVQTPIYKKNVEAAKKIEKNREFLKRSSKQQAGMGDKTQVTAATRPTGDATQIIETESLVQKQKAEMLKASEAIRRRNVGDDTTQILNVSEAPIEMTNPNISIESEQVPDSRQAAKEISPKFTKRFKLFVTKSKKTKMLVYIFVAAVIISILMYQWLLP